MILTLPVQNRPFLKKGKKGRKEVEWRNPKHVIDAIQKSMLSKIVRSLKKRSGRRIRNSSFTESQQRRPRLRKSRWRPWIRITDAETSVKFCFQLSRLEFHIANLISWWVKECSISL
jgi:hypothetical protein